MCLCLLVVVNIIVYKYVHTKKNSIFSPIEKNGFRIMEDRTAKKQLGNCWNVLRTVSRSGTVGTISKKVSSKKHLQGENSSRSKLEQFQFKYQPFLSFRPVRSAMFPMNTEKTDFKCKKKWNSSEFHPNFYDLTRHLSFTLKDQTKTTFSQNFVSSIFSLKFSIIWNIVSVILGFV